MKFTVLDLSHSGSINYINLCGKAIGIGRILWIPFSFLKRATVTISSVSPQL